MRVGKTHDRGVGGGCGYVATVGVASSAIHSVTMKRKTCQSQNSVLK